MKSRSELLFAASIVALACAGEPPRAVDRSAEREPTRAFEAYDLYSWQSADGEWRYALLAGTNRSKTWAEVAAAAIGDDEVERALSALPAGEQLFWCDSSLEGGGEALAWPPPTRLAALSAVARGRGLRLELCGDPQ